MKLCNTNNNQNVQKPPNEITCIDQLIVALFNFNNKLEEINSRLEIIRKRVSKSSH